MTTSTIKPANSIGFRLLVIVLLAVSAAIITITSLFLVSSFQRTVEGETGRLQSSATVLAAALSRSVAGDDTNGSFEVLRGIAGLSNVTFARAADLEGRTIAELGSGVMLMGRDGGVEERGLLSLFMAEAITVQAKIVRGGEQVGTLDLHAEIGWVRGEYLRLFLYAMGIAGTVMTFTAFFAWRRMRRIVSPLTQLAGALSTIGTGSDLSLRLRKTRDDEVGVLIEAFNVMFAKVDDRDRKLRQLNESLEKTVHLRTSQLQHAKDEAERANAAKSDFLATMSHEIRTPMNGMMVMAEMLASAPLAPKHLRFAEIITRSGRGLLHIINDILDLSKIEAGRLELESIPFSLETVVEDVASLFAERAREKSLSISTLVPHDLPQMLAGDPTRIGQIISNLTNNALKFTESGGISIEVTFNAITPDRPRVEIAVRDSGIGIAASALDQVFERFTQADQSTTRKYGGTGLGLSITKRLVDAMNGEISVESVEGQGSVFRVSVELPVLAAARTTTDLQGQRILLAVSDPFTRTAVQRAFAERGASIISDEREFAGISLLVADAGGSQTIGANIDAEVPRILLRSLGSHAGLESSSVWRNAPEVDLPVRNRDMENIARCLVGGDFSQLHANRSNSGQTELRPSFPGLKVLAVDDNAVNREVLIEALSGLGVSPTLADSGPAAIARVTQDSFDIILMDCSMPEMDGFEATRRIRQLEAELGREPVRVVALTAHVTGPESVRWRDAGMDAYVAKPFTIAQLAAALADAGHDIVSAEPLPAVTSEEPAQAGFSQVPLLSPDTLAMFASLGNGGGRAMARRIFDLFATNAPKGAAELRYCEADGDVEEACRLSHALKSMCLSAGAARSAAVCHSLEEAAKEGKMPDAALLELLDQTLTDTISAMSTYGSEKEPVAAPAQ